MGSLGIENIVWFDYIEGPSPETLSKALEYLVTIKALDPSTGKITEKGKIISQFPLAPKMANSIYKA